MRYQVHAAFLLAVCHWFFSVTIVCAADKPPGRPNILLVFTDDHATQAIFAFGSTIAEFAPLDASPAARPRRS